jgi:uncharacterized protein (DUF2062 family)
MRRVFGDLRTEGAGRLPEAVAIGLGAFIGCLPVYGFHLLLCWVVGWGLGLNRLKMYLAANISNPLMAPLLILTEVQAGAWLRRGEPHALTLAAVRAIDPWQFGADLVFGSLVIGAALGALAGAGTYWTSRDDDAPNWYAQVVRRAADRYLSASITAWEFARGKLRGDPLYRTVMSKVGLPAGGTLLEIGCGQGLMLALFAEAQAARHAGEWPSHASLPDRLVGIETRRRVATMAQRALDGAADVIAGDARARPLERSSVILFLDVLHMMPAEDQDRLLASATAALASDGLMLVREPDASGGGKFLAVRFGNRLKAIVTGNWRQPFHFRTAADWSACFEHLGFRVERLETGEGTPFANVLFVLRKPAPATG